MFDAARTMLASLDLPTGDALQLTASEQRFPDGGQYKFEAATVNTLAAAETLLDRLGTVGIRLGQLTHTFGLMRVTDAEIREWVALAEGAGFDLVMSVGPRGTYDTGAQKFGTGIAAHAGGYRLRGMEQVVRAIEDVRRGVELGVRGFLTFDEGLLFVLDQLRSRGELPTDLRLKASASFGVSNPVHCRLVQQLGADSVNLQRDLELPMIAAFRAATTVPLDIHADNPQASGGFIRTYEVPEIVRVAAPVYVKCGNSAVSEHDAEMTSAQAAAMARQIECVAETIARHAPELVESRHRNTASRGAR